MAGGGRAGLSSLGMERGAVDQEDVGVAVAIVVEDGDAGARGLEDIALGGYSTVNVQHRDSGLGRDVFEPRRGRMRGAWRVRCGYPLDGLLGDDGSREKSGVNANYERFRTKSV